MSTKEKRGRGRPEIPEHERLQHITLRLHPDDIAALDKLAGDRGRTTLAREIIERYVRRKR